MTDRDDKIDQALQDALDSVEVPAPRSDVRRRAIAMARAEFEGAQETKQTESANTSQGLSLWRRLIVRKQADKRRAPMYADNKLAYGGMAVVAVAVIAVGITVQSPEQSGHQSDFNLYPPQRMNESISAVSPRREADSNSLEEIALGAGSGGAENYAVRAELSIAPPQLKAEPVPALSASRSAAGNSQQIGNTGAVAYADAVIATPPDIMPRPGYQEGGRDRFEEFAQNPVKLVSEEPVSTFSADVDTASYSFVRRMLNSGVLPQSDAVRAEEMINYFDYDYPLPVSREEPFEPTVVVTDSPWAAGRKLMQIGIKGYEIAPQAVPRSNLVFLLDVSGSMNSPDKLPLVKQSMELLLSTLNPDDTVAIAVYAGAAGTVLEPTPVWEKQKILGAMRQLSAGGSTAGGEGIRLAYDLAASAYDENAVNRVILATDGDFNVGIRSDRELQSFIERRRDDGIFLSVLGFGRGNYQDALMQTLAQNGNGVAAYIDTLGEAQKVLVDEATSSLFPIANDVKFQVEFNPSAVSEYRLIGYETRHLNREDFNNDAVDAGDIGAGHTVTAIYEFTPVGSDARLIEESRYAPQVKETLGMGSEYAFLKIRYKLPGHDESQLITKPVTHNDAVEAAGAVLEQEVGFATAVAGFSQLLKGGKYTGQYDYDDVIELALANRGDDTFGYRNEFVQLVRKAKTAAAMR